MLGCNIFENQVHVVKNFLYMFPENGASSVKLTTSN